MVEEPSSRKIFSQGDPCLMHTNCQKRVDKKINLTNVPCEAIGQLLLIIFTRYLEPFIKSLS